METDLHAVKVVVWKFDSNTNAQLLPSAMLLQICVLCAVLLFIR